MSFQKLDTELEKLISDLEKLNLLSSANIKSPLFLEELNKLDYLITLHDVETYRPVLINNKMKDFYGFSSNFLKGLNYLYYLKTIHVSMYSSLIKSVSFFRKDKEKSLHLNYKLLKHDGSWQIVVGTTQTIFRKHNKKPKYALTLAVESLNLLDNENNFHSISKREQEIVFMLQNHISEANIAAFFSISEHTVRTHIKSIFKKLKIAKKSDLIVLADDYKIPGLNYSSRFTDLTQRERQIVELLGIGLSRKELALCLNISDSTIHTHVKNIFKKLNITSVSELMRLKNPD